MKTAVNQLNIDVANRFSAAASSYHSHDILQRIAAKHLFELMRPTQPLLDLGCGPGTSFTCFNHIDDVICVDIAQGMLRSLKKDFPAYKALCADAQNLPLLDASIATVYSNVALQWCKNLELAVTEANRVLQIGGEFNASIVAENSLYQLSDLRLNVNRFKSEAEILNCFNQDDWQIEQIETRAITVYFDDFKSLLQSIKGVGASTVEVKSQLNQRHVTLRGRGDWQKLLNKAELSRAPEGLPLTYNISFIKARKTR
ncbi:methyltransferase domain-containing protein [Shewanella sp. KX20019]|uniref:methyltransferase domain-containing protein n=1 Tax=Shewanella sp. KX20019 TaxID=2803864 RepID=UPI001926960B|nr:methyltransferase domain-containing protein [Shewanella sp. KX20019]QQX82085.1 methyltransferase domain-containing protein [Shewanella sp. KX20019]